MNDYFKRDLERQASSYLFDLILQNFFTFI